MRTSNRTYATLAAVVLLAGTPSFGICADRTADTTAGRAADDTGKNVRDRRDDSITPEKQSNAKGDVDITRRIRRAIVKDKSLSTNAHNVKIVTMDRSVTLRGPVASEEEKAAIQKKAEKIAGAGKVDNQLEIAKP